MPQDYVILDPPGYFYVSEPGLMWFITGDTLLQRYAAAPAGQTWISPLALYNPPQSEWLLPRPLQFDADWVRNVDIEDYVIPKDKWTFAAGLNPIEFEWGTKKPDGSSNPGNKGIGIPKVPAGTVSLDTRNYLQLTGAVSGNLPTDFVTIALAGQTTQGLPLSEADYSPHFAWGAYPAPDDTLIFGFSNIAFILNRNSYAVVINPENDGQTWKLLDWAQIEGHPLSVNTAPTNLRSSQGSLMLAGMGGLEFRALSALPVGPDELHIVPTQGGVRTVALRKSANPLTTARLFPAGPWWVAARPGQKVAFQCQLVGYTVFGAVPAGGRTPDIDLGENYKPTMTPVYTAQVRFAGVNNPDIAVQDPDPQGFVFLKEQKTNQQIVYGLAKPNGSAFVANGTSSQMGVHLFLNPGVPTAGPPGLALLAPQFRRLDVRIPPKLQPRVNVPLVLEPRDFASWEVETSFHNPNAKRLNVDLYERGVQTISASNHGFRGGYPVEVWRDLNDDGTPDLRVAAGWLESPDMEEIAAETPDRPNSLLLWRLAARGLLSRGDDENGQWEYLPVPVNPQSVPPGTMEHTWLVRECLLLTAFDVTDPSRVVIYSDPYSGTDAAQVPGKWGLESGVVGVKNTDDYAPKWEEGKIPYAQRIASEISGWVIAEEGNGAIFYRPDRALELQALSIAGPFGGGGMTISCTIYRSHAEAADAGVPGQCWIGNPTQRVIDPEANVIRLSSSHEAGEFIPHVICRDVRGVTDGTYRNFLGQPKVFGGLGAGTREDLQRLARLVLKRKKRRRLIWTVEVPLPIEAFQPAPPWLAAGVTLQGRGNWFVIGWSGRMVQQGMYRTRLMLERSPI